MKQSNLPVKIDIVWASGAGAAYVREVPDGSQINVTPGAASWTDGFVPLNMTAKASGGVPPAGQDTNGVLRRLSSWSQYLQAAGIVPYDATFQGSVGGYPLSALVATGYTGAAGTTGTLGRVWVSTVDGNTTNPDTGGAGWLYLTLPADVLALIAANQIGITNVVTYATPGTYTYTPSAGTRAVMVEVQAGGGGGGGTNAPGAGGVSPGISGAGGAYLRKYLLTSTFTTATVVVGAAGVGGSNSGGAGSNGSAGGSSSFTPSAGNALVCTGGAGGANSGTYAGFPAGTATASGGNATNGDVNLGGAPSQAALMLSSSVALIGLAGASFMGTSPIQFGITQPGASGNGRGSGGTGGLAYGGAAAQAGGSGAPGIVIITEFK